jgi:hypothetical protein
MSQRTGQAYPWIRARRSRIAHRRRRQGVVARILLEWCAQMRLEGIQTGDIVEVDLKGRRFHAVVTGSAPGGLALQPTDRRINFYSCRSRDVIGHWARRGRPRQTSEPLRPSPRQLEIDLSPSSERPPG